MKDFKINKIIVNDDTVIEPTRINIIVGPNSSGKSRFLKDLRQLLSNNNYPYDNNNTVVIKKIEYELPDNCEEFIEKYNIEDRIVMNPSNAYIRNFYGVNMTSIDNDLSLNNYMINNNISISNNWREELENDFSSVSNSIEDYNWSLYGIPKNSSDVEIINQELVRYKENGQTIERVIGGTSGPGKIDINEAKNNFIRKYGTLFFQYLGTEEKLLLCKRQKRYGIESTNLNILSELQLHIEDIKELSKITKELFGKYIYLDRSSFGDSLAIRVSDDFDFYNKIELNNSKSESILLNYPLLDDEGDGIKNFVSTYLAIKSMNKKLIILDEPESFLHPPLARRFGEILSGLIKNDQQLFLVTHSEDIINGIIFKTYGTQFNIIRIERDKKINKVQLMPYDYRLVIKKKPIILMSNILKGLFSEKVYITESFSDSALYQDLLIKYNDYSSFYFVNTEGKDKIFEIIKIYDLMGVRNIAIYDFDYFRAEDTIRKTLIGKLGAKKEYQEIYNVFKETNEYIQKISESKVNDELDKLEDISEAKKTEEINKVKNDLYHYQGINCIEDKDLKIKLNSTLEKLKKMGIYVLKTGALETILNELGFEQSKNKPSWIDNALEFVGQLTKDELKKSKIIDLISGKV